MFFVATYFVHWLIARVHHEKLEINVRFMFIHVMRNAAVHICGQFCGPNLQTSKELVDFKPWRSFVLLPINFQLRSVNFRSSPKTSSSTPIVTTTSPLVVKTETEEESHDELEISSTSNNNLEVRSLFRKCHFKSEYFSLISDLPCNWDPKHKYRRYRVYNQMGVGNRTDPKLYV